MIKLSWVLQILCAVILAQTLYFKFSGAPESVWIFSRLGMEPWGRYLTGGLELVAVLLLLVPRTIWMGATLAGGLMLGAIISHLAVLGVVVIGPDGRGDGGLLFSLAAIDGLFAAAVLWIRRDSIPFLARE